MTEVLENKAIEEEAEKEELRKKRAKQIRLKQLRAKEVLIGRGAQPLPKFESYLYIDRPGTGKRDIYAPDGQGGYYLRNTVKIPKYRWSGRISPLGPIDTEDNQSI